MASESTARWFGPWGRVLGGDGSEFRVQMAYEEGKPWLDGRIEAFDAPHLVTVRTKSAHRKKVLSLELVEDSGTTTLEFVHHQVNREAIGELGQDWELYLDMLVAARGGTSAPKFDTYYPAQKDH